MGIYMDHHIHVQVILVLDFHEDNLCYIVQFVQSHIYIIYKQLRMLEFTNNVYQIYTIHGFHLTS